MGILVGCLVSSGLLWGVDGDNVMVQGEQYMTYLDFDGNRVHNEEPYVDESVPHAWCSVKELHCIHGRIICALCNGLNGDNCM